MCSNKIKPIKLVVWDLDNTLWNGVLLEDASVELRAQAVDIIKELDQRGVLHSIASRNDKNLAMQKLQSFEIKDYFLHPEIRWGAKVDSIQEIAKKINISLDAVAFIDDDLFERENIGAVIPSVLCFDSRNLDLILKHPRFEVGFITEDAKNRRKMYLDEQRRQADEQKLGSSKEAFLASLNMELILSFATENDLKRAGELTQRTNQLNTTGYIYSYEELDFFRLSKKHKLIVAELKDKYGNYGKIGLALIECKSKVWVIKLLLISCRVMNRGVGSALIIKIIEASKNAGVTLQAEFVANDVNRMMYMTYKFLGFKERQKTGSFILLEHASGEVPSLPSYFTIISEDLSKGCFGDN